MLVVIVIGVFALEVSQCVCSLFLNFVQLGELYFYDRSLCFTNIPLLLLLLRPLRLFQRQRCGNF